MEEGVSKKEERETKVCNGACKRLNWHQQDGCAPGDNSLSKDLRKRGTYNLLSKSIPLDEKRPIFSDEGDLVEYFARFDGSKIQVHQDRNINEKSKVIVKTTHDLTMANT